MKKIDIQYSYNATYEYPLKEGVLQFLICAKRFCQTDLIIQNTADIQILSESIESSEKENLVEYVDVFGNRKLFLRIATGKAMFTLDYKATIHIPDFIYPPQLFTPVQEEWYRNAQNRIAYYPYCLLTALCDKIIFPEPMLKDFSEPMIAYCIRACALLNKNIRYVSGKTDVNTPASIAWQLQSGVCQDLAHIFLVLLRRQNIPCRYVSGYLAQGNQLTGDLSMHAWVEIYLHPHGWLGLDPTNNLLADDFYIKVAHGLDYSDCATIKGVILTPGDQKGKQFVHVSQQ